MIKACPMKKAREKRGKTCDESQKEENKRGKTKKKVQAGDISLEGDMEVPTKYMDLLI